MHLNEIRARNFANEALWSILAGAISQSTSLLVVFILVRNLGTEGYGKYSYLIMIAAFFSAVCSSGVNIAATVNISRLLDDRLAIIDECRRFYNLAWFASMLSASAYMIFSIYEIYVSNNVATNDVVNGVLLTIYIFAVSFDSIQIGLAFGLGIFRKLALVNVIKSGVLLVLMLLTSKNGDYSIVLLALALSWAINTIVDKALIEKHLGVKISPIGWFSVEEYKFWLRGVSRFSLPLLVSALFTAGSVALSNHMASGIEGGFIYIGVASIGRQWIFIHQFIPAQISNMALSKLSTAHNDTDAFNRSIRSYILTSTIIAALTSGLGVLMFWLLRDSTLAALKIEFSTALIFVGAGFLAVLNNTLGYVLVASKNTDARLRADITIGVVLLIVSYITLNKNPSIAIPWAMFLAFLFGIIELVTEIALRGRRVDAES